MRKEWSKPGVTILGMSETKYDCECSEEDGVSKLLGVNNSCDCHGQGCNCPCCTCTPS